jgi:hypothetical protein
MKILLGIPGRRARPPAAARRPTLPAEGARPAWRDEVPAVGTPGRSQALISQRVPRGAVQ